MTPDPVDPRAEGERHTRSVDLSTEGRAKLRDALDYCYLPETTVVIGACLDRLEALERLADAARECDRLSTFYGPDKDMQRINAWTALRAALRSLDAVPPGTAGEEQP
jgi:hypothetical protein